MIDIIRFKLTLGITFTFIEIIRKFNIDKGDRMWYTERVSLRRRRRRERTEKVAESRETGTFHSGKRKESFRKRKKGLDKRRKVCYSMEARPRGSAEIRRTRLYLVNWTTKASRDCFEKNNSSQHLWEISIREDGVFCGNTEVKSEYKFFLTESLILAQDERWRRA